jgi:hypothetical protein
VLPKDGVVSPRRLLKETYRQFVTVPPHAAEEQLLTVLTIVRLSRTAGPAMAAKRNTDHDAVAGFDLGYITADLLDNTGALVLEHARGVGALDYECSPDLCRRHRNS